MEKKQGVSAALAAIILAAGINASTAGETCCALDRQVQAISSLNSVEAMERELAGLRATDPASPLISVLISQMTQTSQIAPQSSPANSSADTPY